MDWAPPMPTEDKRTYIIIKHQQSLTSLLVVRLHLAQIQPRGLMSGMFRPDILQQQPQHGRCPRMTRMAHNTSQQRGVSLFLFGRRHGQAAVDGMGDIEQVVRVDSQGGREGRGGAHEFRQDQWGFVGFILAHDEFHRSGVHAVSERSDEG